MSKNIIISLNMELKFVAFKNRDVQGSHSPLIILFDFRFRLDFKSDSKKIHNNFENISEYLNKIPESQEIFRCEYKF